MPDRRVAVVGGGLSGLVCARLLKNEGIDCFVLDRGRNPGGRVSTKSMTHNDQTFLMNHGAPKLNCHEECSREIMSRLGVPVSDQAIVQCEDMQAVIRQLATGIPTESSTEVLKLQRDGTSWVLHAKRYGQDDAFHAHASDIVFACPSVQASRVLDASGLERPTAFHGVRYASQWVLLVIAESATLASLSDTILCSAGECTHFESVEATQRAGDRVALIARMCPNRSSALYNSNPEIVRAEMSNEIVSLLEARGCSAQILESSVHRWGLARGVSQIQRSHLCWSDQQISFIGDSFSGAHGNWRDADASILSASSLATHLRKSESA